MMTNNFLLCLLLLLLANAGYAQPTDRTITVTGSSTYNLSPDEIIVEIAFQEYFADGEDQPDSKVPIERLERQVMDAITAVEVQADKITSGAARVVRPIENRVYQRRRLNKTLYVCVNSTEEYIALTRQLEKDGLLNEIITDYSIVEYRHTQREAYLRQSRSAAFENAREKAELILSESGETLGAVVRIEELDPNRSATAPGSFYTVESSSSQASGFQPIVIAYELRVTFGIR